MIEDDSQDGGDHVDSHRSVAFVIGPYVKQKKVVSAPYTTLSVLRTIEEILGTGNLSLSDSSAKAMTDVFDISLKPWTYTAIPPDDAVQHSAAVTPRQTASRGAAAHARRCLLGSGDQGMDFSVEDRLDPVVFNQVLWRGLMGSKPYPAISSGADLRENRQQLLEQYRTSREQSLNSDHNHCSQKKPKLFSSGFRLAGLPG